MGSNLQLVYTVFTDLSLRTDLSVPRLRTKRMDSLLHAIPVNGVYLPDFPWKCRYPRNEWTIENIKWKSEKKSESLPRPIAVCGPSGSGKSTLLKRLLEEYRDYIEFSISHTTRKPRPNEVDGKDYHFVSREEMEEAIANDEFLEHAEFSGNIYGTSKNAVKQIQNNGKLCILDVEMIGVKNLRKTNLNPKFIFVKTPSIEVLEKRLRNRNTESEESLQKRLARAREELVYGETPGNFDLIVVNDDLEEAYRQLKEFLISDIEALKKQKMH
ncbi:guanylate kinase [Trichonephila inaurata madagascariensis]|uniref:guanylate kinase n=1 Tax=Trichonephila inaurata madagascariensis TaxID=2747483 RepID=A0A8X6XDK5_9ARAC|nr:guanylate kinase [Trichonephila inaurata madagascariensis]